MKMIINLVTQGYSVKLSEGRNGKGIMIELSREVNFDNEYNYLLNTDPAKLEQDIETCRCELEQTIKTRRP